MFYIINKMIWNFSSRVLFAALTRELLISNSLPEYELVNSKYGTQL